MSKLIALRVPEEMLASIDAMAKAEGMNRSQAIIALLRETDMPLVSGAEGSGVVESRAVAPVVAPVVTPKKTPTPVEDRPAARFSGCSKCGALGGMHQKGCGK